MRKVFQNEVLLQGISKALLVFPVQYMYNYELIASKMLKNETILFLIVWIEKWPIIYNRLIIFQYFIVKGR